MDNILIISAVCGLGTFLYIYVAPMIASVSETLNSLPF